MGGDRRAIDGEVIALMVCAFAGLVAFILWFDNLQIITTNGVFKALTIREWTTDPASARLDPSNYLYYPAMAAICRLLDLIGIMPGDPRHQIGVINALFASLSLGIFYKLVLCLTGERIAAFAAALFHLAGAFFFNLTVSNEDILPSYTVLLFVMTLACLWFTALTWQRVVILSALFTLAWLLEWRLLFPTLPALLILLALGQGTAWRRIANIGLFLAVMVAIAKVAILLWGPHSGNVGPVSELLWTGKGIDSGWAGFTAVKFTFMWVGITQYLAGGINLGDLTYLPGMLSEMRCSTAFIVGLAIASLIILWKKRHSPEHQAVAVVFGTTFVAGQLMNLYAQPQDPQMQLNVMPWLTVAWGLFVGYLAGFRPIVGMIPAIAVATVLLNYNIGKLLPMRGEEANGRQTIKALERQFDPASTVFLLHGFEGLVADIFYAWHGDWTYFNRLGPAPSTAPKAKMLLAADSFIHQSSASGQSQSDAFLQKIERAMNLGYEVVANRLWTMTPDEFAASLSTVTDATKAKRVHAAFHEAYSGRLIFEDPHSGPYFMLSRRSREKPNGNSEK